MTRTTDPASLPYRPCVGVMLLNRQGLAFVGRRIDRDAANETGIAWQMPQGGVDPGEDLAAAALRELNEETGIAPDAVALLAESAHWHRYDLPPYLLGVALKGKFRGQTQKWFAARFLGEDADVRLDVHGEPEFDAWRWAPLAELSSLIVPFKRSVYDAVVAEFAHLAAGVP